MSNATGLSGMLGSRAIDAHTRDLVLATLNQLSMQEYQHVCRKISAQHVASSKQDTSRRDYNPGVNDANLNIVRIMAICRQTPFTNPLKLPP